MQDESVKAAPFLGLRVADGRVEQRGLAACRLGTPLDRGRATPDGAFADWAWDGRRLVARNDRYGFRPLFYFAADGAFGISPSIPRLLQEGAPTDVDAPALAVFIRTGYYLGEDTPFRAIRALPPNATVEWSEGRLRVEGGYAAPPPSRSIGRDAAIDGYIALFREAVRRRLPASGEFAMPLSGGRDSRHILLQAVQLGARPAFCLTVRHHPPRFDEDVELAAEVAGALGLPQVVLDQTGPRLRAELRKNLKTSLGSDEGTAFMAMEGYLAGRTRAVFDGVGGDFLSDGRFQTDPRIALLEAGRIPELADALLWRRPHLPSLLSDDWRARLARDVAVRRLQAELERHLDAPNPIMSYIFWNRCRREIALFSASFYGDEVETICPYLDHDVFDYLTSLPHAVFRGGSFHAETVRRAFPEYAHIPFEPQGSPFRFDDRYRRELLATIGDVAAYLEERPTRLLAADLVRERLARHAEAGREPIQFSPHLIYALQLERLADRSAGPA